MDDHPILLAIANRLQVQAHQVKPQTEIVEFFSEAGNLIGTVTRRTYDIMVRKATQRQASRRHGKP